MKKIIKPEDFPLEINEENIRILAEMKLNYPPPIKFPPPLEYRQIIHFLSENDKILISNKIKEIQDEQEKIRWNSLTPEEQEDEKRKLEESYNDTTSFRGNILEQERHSIYIEKKRKNNNS